MDKAKNADIIFTSQTKQFTSNESKNNEQSKQNTIC